MKNTEENLWNDNADEKLIYLTFDDVLPFGELFQILILNAITVGERTNNSWLFYFVQFEV